MICLILLLASQRLLLSNVKTFVKLAVVSSMIKRLDANAIVPLCRSQRRAAAFSPADLAKFLSAFWAPCKAPKYSVSMSACVFWAPCKAPKSAQEMCYVFFRPNKYKAMLYFRPKKYKTKALKKFVTRTTRRAACRRGRCRGDRGRAAALPR